MLLQTHRPALRLGPVGSGSLGAGSGAQDLDRLFRGFCGTPLARVAGFAQASLDQVQGRHISREFTALSRTHSIFVSAIVPSIEHARSRRFPKVLRSTTIRVMLQSKSSCCCLINSKLISEGVSEFRMRWERGEQKIKKKKR